jgi:multiple sugar transport system ATP-binding protein
LGIHDGEFLTLVGPSGCGKSTLLRIIAGLETQDAGSVAIGCRTVDGMRPRDRDVAMVFQSYALYPHMTVADNLALPLRMRRLTPAQRLPLVGRLSRARRATERTIRTDVEDTAAALEIGHLLTRKPSQLSGGQRQRVALGRAMVRRPQVFLMDEPLSNLDAKLRVQMRAELAHLHRRLGATFIYVTHDQTEAMTMSDRVAVMMDGELLQVGTPAAVYEAPAHLKVAEFIGSPAINLFGAVARDDGTIESGPVRLPVSRQVRPGAAVTIGVRPEALRLERDGGGWRGTVSHIEYLGAELLVHVATPAAARPAVIRLEPDARLRPAIGDAVSMRPLPGRAHLFDTDGQRIAPPAQREAPAGALHA